MRASLVALILITLATSARADTPVDAPRAQRLFEEGSAALSRGELTSARAKLDESLGLLAHPATAFNLAVTLRGLGQAVEAVDVLTALDGGRYGALASEQRREVAELRTAVRRELGTLVLTLSGAARATLSVDGHLHGELIDGVTRRLPANPGERLIQAESASHLPVVRRVAVERGQDTRVDLHLQATGVPVASRAEPAAPRVTLVRSPWFWAASAVLAAGITTLVLLRPFERSAERDPVFGVTRALGTF